MNKYATLYAPKLQNGSMSCLTIILLLLNSVHIFFINSWAEPDLDFNATVTSLLLCSSYTWYKSCKDVLICSVDVEHTVLKKLLPGNRHLHLFLIKKRKYKIDNDVLAYPDHLRGIKEKTPVLKMNCWNENIVLSIRLHVCFITWTPACEIFIET